MQKTNLYLWACVLALFAAMLYLPTLWHGYVWDDLFYLVDYSYYFGADGLSNAISTPFFLSGAYYRPLVVLSFVAVPSIMEYSAMIHHAINIAIHAANTALIFFVAQALLPELLRKQRIGLRASAAGALMFAVHPLAVEPVAWISGRFDLLMTTFVLATVIVVLCCSPILKRSILIFVLFSLAIFSKESAVGLFLAVPFVLLVQKRLRHGYEKSYKPADFIRENLIIYIPMMLATVVYLVVRIAVIGDLFSSKHTVTFNGSIVDKINVASMAILEFLRLVLNPWSYSAPLHPFYFTPGEGLSLLAISIITGIALLLISCRKSNVSLAILSFLGMVWPALHLFGIPNGENIISDRYALTAFGLLVASVSAIFSAYCVQRNLSRLMHGIIFFSCIIAIFFLGVYSRVTIPLWKNDVIFWNFVHKTVPQSTMAAGNYMQTLMKQGRWKEANEKLQKILSHSGKELSMAFITNWMVIRGKMNDYDDAVKVFNFADSVDLQNQEKSELYCARGVLELEMKQWDQAEYYFREGYGLNQKLILCGIFYAQALYKVGKKMEGMDQLNKSLQFVSNELRDNIREKSLSW